MNWNNSVAVLAVTLLLACESGSLSQLSPIAVAASAVAPDINAGKRIAAQCEQCHAANNGALQGATPFLAGQHVDYLTLALKSYSDGTRTHKPTQAHAQGLTQQDIESVSAWYAGLTAPWKGAASQTSSAVKKPDPALVSAGQALSQSCNSCHGIDGNSVKPGTPSLAGLQPEYFIKALNSYFTGERSDPIMSLFKESLDKEKSKSLAAFYANQPRTKTSVASTGNTLAGKAKAAACAGCHGADGNSINPTMPSLAGQNASYLEKALLAYHGGQRNDSMMQSAVKTLKPDDMRNLAAFYAAQPPRRFGEPTAAPKGVFDPLGDGERLAQNCSGCHGENGNSRTPGIPSLSRLHNDYLAGAIKAYRNGVRNHEMMKNFVQNLSDDDVTRLALYYASREPKSAPGSGAQKALAGEKLAATCAGCHGERGNSKNATTPSLAGQEGAYLIAAIRSYAHGARKHADMENAVKSLKDAEVAQLAAYFATQTGIKPAISIPEAPDVIAQKCNRCHGDNGLSTDPKIPRIAGQSERYLADALRAYKSEARTSSAMKAMAGVLSDLEISALAAYYARKP